MSDAHEPHEPDVPSRPPSWSRLVVTGLVLIATAAVAQFAYLLVLRAVTSQTVLLALGYTMQAVNTALPAIGTALLGAGLVIRYLEGRR